MNVQQHHGRSVIAKSSLFNLLGLILPAVVGITTLPYIVKGLGTDGYGILSIAYLVLGYFSIFDLGLSRATVKFVAEHLSPDQIHKVPGLVWTSLGLLVGLGVLFGGVGALIVPWLIMHFFKMPTSMIADARLAIIILCLSMPVVLGSDALRGVLEAAQRFDLINLVKVPSSILFYLSVAVAISLGVKVPGIICILVLIRFVSTAVYLIFCFRVFPGLRENFHFSREALGPLTVFGGWIMISNVTGPVFGYLERFMIASMLSVTMLTYYSVPFDLVGKTLVFPMSIIPSLFPYFSYHGARGRTEVSEVTARVAKYMLLILTPAAAVFFFFAKQILKLWMGAEFAIHSTVVMQLVTVLFFLNAFALLPYTSVQALGRPQWKAVLDLLVLPIYAVAAWLCMRHFGVNGAALAKLLVTILDFSALYVFAAKLNAFSIRDCFAGSLMRALVLSGVLVISISAISAHDSNVTITALLVTSSFLLYGLAFWFFAAEDDEKLALHKMWLQRFALMRREQLVAPVPILEKDPEG